MDKFRDHAARDELTCSQRWQIGDLIVWDNRCTMQLGDGFAGQGRGPMHRLMIPGERLA